MVFVYQHQRTFHRIQNHSCRRKNNLLHLLVLLQAMFYPFQEVQLEEYLNWIKRTEPLIKELSSSFSINFISMAKLQNEFDTFRQFSTSFMIFRRVFKIIDKFNKFFFELIDTKNIWESRFNVLFFLNLCPFVKQPNPSKLSYEIVDLLDINWNMHILFELAWIFNK